MARENGYVYYEADNAMCFLNPFVDPNVNIDIDYFGSATRQKPLKVQINYFFQICCKIYLHRLTFRSSIFLCST